MIRMKLICSLIFYLASILFAVTANASDNVTFIIGVEDNRYFPHYSYEDGEYSGIGRQILDAFFISKGYKYKYRALPVARLFQSFVDGDIDFKYPDNAFWSTTLKSGKGVIYSNTVMPSTDGVMVLPENVGKKSANQIKILGTIRGFTAPQWMGRVEKGEMILAENDNSKLLVKQVLAKRIEGAYANIDVVNYILRKDYKDANALVFDPMLPHTKDYYYFSTIKYPKIIDEFNTWLIDNKEFIQSLKTKYGIIGHPH